jgi:hypothetical protein
MCKSLTALLAGLFLILAGGASAEPPVWVVRSPTATIVLFGSVHLLPAGLDWEPAKLKAAIAEADDLWFEIPIDDASALSAQRIALARGLEPPGVRLRDQLPPADQARMFRIAAQCGVPIDGLDRLKPWLAEVTLSLAAYRQVGALREDGVERALSASAPAALKRRAFETPEEQIGFLAGAPLPDQVASLEETLGELEQGAASYERLVSAWMAGDPAAIEAEAVAPLKKEAPGVYRTLVVDRNRRWVKAIKQRLREPGVSVMVVGVGHLVGADGVPALLRGEGVSVEGP